MDSRKATVSGQNIVLLLLAFLVSLIGSFLINGLFALLSFFIALLVFYHLILREMFAGPKTRSPALEDKDYTIVKTNNDGIDIYGYVRYQEKKADIVVFLHGWMSSSERFLERMKLFHDHGFHTLAHDMRGHGIAPETYEWTAGKVVNDLILLLEKIDKKRVNKVHFLWAQFRWLCVNRHA